MYMLLFGVVLFGFRARAANVVVGPDVSLGTDVNLPASTGVTNAVPAKVNLGVGIKLGALCAFVVAVVSLIFQMVPVADVPSRLIYALKIGSVIAATNSLGAFLYWRGARRAKSAATNLAPGRAVE
jgi:hypothetical protein